MNKKSLAAAVAVVGLGVSILGASSAVADPPSGTYGTLAGVGSDTTESVMNGIASTYAAAHSGNYLIASYDAFGSAQIQTKSAGACVANRPGGSGPGADRLRQSTLAGDGCVDFARSSSGPGSSQAGYQQTFIPFATDAVSYAIRSDSSISKKLTAVQLKAIYDCSYGTTYQPLLPNYGSGTRKFFLQSLGYSSTDQNNASFAGSAGHECVVDAGQENNGTLLTNAKQIIPFSIGSYLGQFNGVASSTLGKAVLGRVGDTAAFNLNASSPFNRTVYNVVPTNKLGDSDIVSAFVGTNGQGTGNNSVVCSDQADIQRYGFALNANCGATSTVTP